MSNKYLMGIDVGTQSAKVLIFDLDGNVICQGKKALRAIVIPAPLLAEHPEDDLWDALSYALKEVMTNFNKLHLNPKDILAIGVCGIRCCRVLLKADGSLAYPVINWMDKRLNAPYEYLPEYGDVRYVTTTSGYLTHRLTDEFKDTCANYIGWWPMDNDTWTWATDSELMKSCHLSREMLFDVVKPGEILGYITQQVADLTGIPKGLPVVATAHDKAVEALGSGSLEEGVALVSLGTYIGAMVHGHTNIKTAQNFWPFLASSPDNYLYECMGVRRGMWTISWFRNEFGEAVRHEAERQGVPIETIFDQEAEAVPAGCEGLITIHDWAPPVEALYRKGVVFGFDGRHTRGHIYRSILEGIAFTMKNHMDKMAEELSQPFKKLVISGGGSNSNIFMQIFADIFGIPTTRNLINGAAAVGSVINAGMAVGVFDSYEQAVKKMVKQGDVFMPNMTDHSFYNQLNKKVYLPAHTYLDPLLEKLSPLVD